MLSQPVSHWGQAVFGIFSKYLEPLLKLPTISPAARLPAAAVGAMVNDEKEGKPAEHAGEKGNVNTCAQALSGKAKNT